MDHEPSASFDRLSPKPSLDLLGGFELRLNERVVILPMTAKRLLVFLALSHRPLGRPYVSQSLWLDSSGKHADGNLRSALWKIGQLDTCLVNQSGGQLALGSTVAVDYRRSLAIARKLVSDPPFFSGSQLDEQALTADLLPDWYEEWILAERERYRQVRLHALEYLCQHLVSLGMAGQAVRSGLAAVAGEPLRESANVALIRAYVAEGNASQAIRHYHSYRNLLWEDLGIRPSEAMTQSIEDLRPR